MLRKIKCYYPEEEIIDGFSILCFDKYQNLEKFSKSLKADIRNSVLNSISKCNDSEQNSVKRKKVTKPQLESKALLKPTRITAKRKSKPDISILSLYTCKQKRLNRMPPHLDKPETVYKSDHVISPVVIDVEQDLAVSDKDVREQLESESKCNSVKEECLDLNDTYERLNEDCAHCGIRTEDYSNNSHTDCSIVAESVITSNSTSSPISIQPIHFESESLDLSSPEKADLIQDDSNKISIDLDTEKDSNNSICDIEINQNKIIEDDDDDCVILSVGFDPDPRLSHIPISNCQQVVEDVPQLKPAPPIVFSISTLPTSLKAIVVSSKSMNVKPPPLIPAPAEYFSFLQRDQVSTKAQSVCRNLEPSNKYRSRKRCQIKSLVLKPSPYNMKPSQTPVPIRSNGKPQFPANTNRPLLTPVPNGKLYSLPMNTIRPLTSTPTLTKVPSSISSKSALPNAISYNFKLPKPIPIYNTNTNQSIKPFYGSSQHLIRKTICHVHIAQLIRKKHNVDNFMANSLVSNRSNPCLTKPRPLRPIAQSFNLSQSFSPLNLNSNVNMTQSLLNRKPQNQFNYPTKMNQSFNSLKSMRDLPVYIRPLNNTYQLSNTFDSCCPNSINIFQKESIVLLK